LNYEGACYLLAFLTRNSNINPAPFLFLCLCLMKILILRWFCKGLLFYKRCGINKNPKRHDCFSGNILIKNFNLFHFGLSSSTGGRSFFFFAAGKSADKSDDGKNQSYHRCPGHASAPIQPGRYGQKDNPDD